MSQFRRNPKYAQYALIYQTLNISKEHMPKVKFILYCANFSFWKILIFVVELSTPALSPTFSLSPLFSLSLLLYLPYSLSPFYSLFLILSLSCSHPLFSLNFSPLSFTIISRTYEYIQYIIQIYFITVKFIQAPLCYFPHFERYVLHGCSALWACVQTQTVPCWSIGTKTWVISLVQIFCTVGIL